MQTVKPTQVIYDREGNAYQRVVPEVLYDQTGVPYKRMEPQHPRQSAAKPDYHSFGAAKETFTSPGQHQVSKPVQHATVESPSKRFMRPAEKGNFIVIQNESPSEPRVRYELPEPQIQGMEFSLNDRVEEKTIQGPPMNPRASEFKPVEKELLPSAYSR